MPTADLDAARANAHAIAFRLLGDRSVTRAVVDTSLERLRSSGGLDRPDWLCAVAAETVAGSVGSLADALTSEGGGGNAGVPASEAAGSDAARRAELRRRLAAATPEERVAASLHHLAGYPIEAVAVFTGHPTEEAARLADVLRPAPGESYRFLGDPELVGPAPSASEHRPLLSRTTVLSILVVVGLVLGAGRCVGARPTLAPAGSRVRATVGPDVSVRPSVGCGVAGPGAGTSEAIADGLPAPVPYRLAIPQPTAPPTAPGPPPGASTATPRALLVAVADDTTAAAFADGQGPEHAALAAGFVVATTTPAGGPAGPGNPPGPSRVTPAVSVASVAAVIRHVRDHMCIDESRVTVTGLGVGAQVATLLACADPDLVAVAAPVAGASMTPGCRLSPAVSLLLQWNADDTTRPPTGGDGPSTPPLGIPGASADAAGAVSRDWARAIGAGRLARTVEPDGTAVEQATSDEGASVRSVIAPTGGHSWSPATTAAVLDFAAAHARAPA